MVSINWRLKQKDGIKLIEENDNLAQGYLKMAENALGTMSRERKYNLSFALSAGYYSMYYSLYSVLMKLGIRCEIHSCTIEFMKSILNDFYFEEDVNIIKKAFNLRISAQYYVDKIIEREDSDFVILKAPLFFNKSKEILYNLNEDNIKEIRGKLKEIGTKNNR